MVSIGGKGAESVRTRTKTESVHDARTNVDHSRHRWTWQSVLPENREQRRTEMHRWLHRQWCTQDTRSWKTAEIHRWHTADVNPSSPPKQHGLSIGTTTFDLGWPWAVLVQRHQNYTSNISKVVIDTTMGRIGNHLWTIDWHRDLWHWMTLNRPMDVGIKHI